MSNKQNLITSIKSPSWSYWNICWCLSTSWKVYLKKRSFCWKTFIIRCLKLNLPSLPIRLCGPEWIQFYTRYKEQRNAFYHNSFTSNFAKHLQGNAHPFGPIGNIMQVFHHHKKETRLNTIERFHFTLNTAGNHLNDDHTIFPNRIFDTLIKLSTPLPTP